MVKMEQNVCPWYGTNFGYECPEGGHEICFTTPCSGPSIAEEMGETIKTDRERLIEILRVPIYPRLDAEPEEVVADCLIDNGVTFKEPEQRMKWINRGSGKASWCECPVCHTMGSPQWKVCPLCETKMETGCR